MPEHLYRDAGTGQIVTEEYALENPTTTVKETIELSDQDREDLAKLDDGVTAVPDPTYHPVLQVWREILKPARDELDSKITPQWASRIVQSYQDVGYNDMPAMRDRYYGKILELLYILETEIASDDECLNYSTPEEDVLENRAHYFNLLRDWQLQFLRWELSWDCTDPHAGVELAAVSEVHKAFFGQTGVTQYLENIKLELTPADQDELAAALEELRGEQ